MAVRRLHPDQPEAFAFTAENLAWAKSTIANYPPGKQASAVIPLLWRAQEQHAGWLSEPAIRYVADMLSMAYIRVYEIATFYTMFQLAPVGRKAHVQVCGTTPCMLRGAEALKEVCRNRIHHDAHHVSADGNFSWEEVECLGSCANAPMVQIWQDTYEDLTPELFERVLDGFAGKAPRAKPGSQIGRRASAPVGNPTTLTDPSLYDGSRVGAWRARLSPQPASAAAAPAAGGAAATAAAPPAPPPAVAASPAAVAVKPEPAAAAAAPPAPQKPPLLAKPREGAGDDLKLIWGVGEKLAERMNELGIWHYDQVAAWTPAEVAWFEAQLPGFKGRIERDKWLEQARKLAAGWRPEGNVGERPKG
jgi:NADH-quinone oxidoreductase subunit E